MFRPGKKNARPSRRTRPYSRRLLLDPGDQLGGVGLELLTQVLQPDLLRPPDGTLGHPAGQAGLPGERGVAAGVDEAVRPYADLAVPGGEGGGLDPAVTRLDVEHRRAEDDLDAQRVHQILHPPAEHHLVVRHGDRVALVEVDVVGPAQVREHRVEDPVREPAVLRSVAVHAAEQPDERVHALAAENRQGVGEDDGSAEPPRLHGGGQAGDAGPDDADVGGQLLGRITDRLGDGVDLKLGELVRHSFS